MASQPARPYHEGMTFVINRMLPMGSLTESAETAADALATASEFVAAGEVVKIVGPDGEDLSFQELEARAEAEATNA